MAIFNVEYSKTDGKQVNISKLNSKVRSYIDKGKEAELEKLLSEEKDFQTFFQLSQLRTGLLSWYQFQEDAKVLEVGGGFGTLTGHLADRCAQVTVTERSMFRAESIAKRYEDKDNIIVYAGDIFDISFTDKFDVIILCGILERIGNGSSEVSVYSEYLKRLSGLLTARGRILFAVENRYGLRYFCGAVEPHTQRAFDGINRYPKGTSGYSFSRNELVEIVERAGFEKYKFYYPLPDYKFPQLIYTDEYLPEKNLKERLLPYYQRNDTLVAQELELYDDVISNHAFPFMANSFLVECGCEDTLCEVVYAAVSTDRGRNRSFCTSITKNNNNLTVNKRALYTEGKESVNKLKANFTDLQNHGIPVISGSFSGEEMKMPYIAYPTLSNYIKEIITTDISLFESLIERLYDYILKSSVTVSGESNALVTHLIGKAVVSEDDMKDVDFGPILEKAYIELIPLNCFINPDTKEFLYFDQEFVRDNYPAKYILFRAIHYIYCFTPRAETIYPKEQLLEKYEMKELWEFFTKEEALFLDDVRNREDYAQFYQWNRIDKARLSDNVARLEQKITPAAKTDDYIVSDKMKKTWQVELNILDEIDRICKKYSLTYFLVHGSLLGAVRHKGFVPWDDDLDIAMLRKDYDTFLEVAPKELKTPLSLHTMATETDIFWGGFAKIKNADTTAIPTRELTHEANLGIWVDVLPIDYCTEDERLFVKKQKKIRHCHRLFLAKIYGKEFKRYADMNPWLWRCYRLLSWFYSFANLSGRLNHAMQLYTDKSNDVAVFSGYYQHRRLSAKLFSDTCMLDFEGRKVPAPVKYEEYLRALLGNDYRKLPPVEERKPKHAGIYDPEKPYGEYQKLFNGMFEGCKGKQIILFGSGFMFEDYMKKYGSQYRPSLLVDNDQNKWDRRRMGIPIASPQRILGIPKSKRHLIICSFYYKEISKQLDEMGITDYKVYIQNMDWILQAES